MKFLVDAHLPYRLVSWLKKERFDAIHTHDLALGNRTPDSTINELSLSEERIVITKDEDFVDSFLIDQKPYKLLLISTGNIKNTELVRLFIKSMKQIEEAFAKYDFIELGQKKITFHM